MGHNVCDRCRVYWTRPEQFFNPFYPNTMTRDHFLHFLLLALHNNKLNKNKIYKLCDKTGYTYDMEVYLGKDRKCATTDMRVTHATETTDKKSTGVWT
jgi:hypothetical protein